MRTSHDIREMLRGTACKNKTAPQESDQKQTTTSQETPDTTHEIQYGPEICGQELVNREENFRRHIEETRRLDKEREDLIEEAQKKEKSWELLRVCTTYLKENEKNWKQEDDKNYKLAKNIKLKQAETQKAATLSRLTQSKITETWNKLPKDERKLPPERRVNQKKT